MPGLGYLVFERGTQDLANAPLNPAQLPDILDRQSIKLSRRIARPHDLGQIVYRITLSDDKDPAKTFAQDARQTVRNVKGNTFEMVVRAVRTPPTQGPANGPGPGAEFLESNYFITGADERVKQHAAAAVGREADPWKKALLIEQWVHHNMKVQDFTEAMAPASHVAQTLEGDCTEYAMLAAAMCRAAGVPSRTAIGLVYVDAGPPRPPFLGFHMWTEVYVRGAWVAIDATLGQRGIGPAHLKIADASWHDTRSMTPLLPLMRVMLGRPQIEVVEAR
jgi:transglutaminase-like putative cysteine protease